MKLGRLLDRAYWVQDRLAYSLRQRGLGGTVRFVARRAAGLGPAPASPRSASAPWPERETSSESKERARLLRALSRLPLVSIVSTAGPESPLVRSLARQAYPRHELASSLASAGGELVAFLRPGDRLRPDALLRLVERLEQGPGLDLAYADHALPEGSGAGPVLKPDWSPELMRARDYVGRAWLARRSFLEALGGDPCDALRAVPPAARIGRVPRVLFQLEEPDAANGAPAERRPVAGDPVVSIVIPTRDRAGLLRGAVESLERYAGARRLELVLVDNGSSDPEALSYLAELSGRCQVLRHAAPFNWSALNNLGARRSSGDHLLFLNNDVEALAPRWLDMLLSHAQDPGVGPVGARLLYPDGTVQHAGVIVGQGGIAGHPFRGAPPDATEPFFGPAVTRNWSAVTGACLLVRRNVFDALGGFDERLPVAYNDVDFCLRARERGLRVVYEPAATLLHRESASRSRVDPWRDTRRFKRRWRGVLAEGDPFGHPLLDLTVPEGIVVDEFAQGGGVFR